MEQQSNPPPPGDNPPPSKPTAAPPINTMESAPSFLKPGVRVPLQAPPKPAMPSAVAPTSVTTNDAAATAPKPPSQPTPKPMSSLELKPSAALVGMAAAAGVIKPRVVLPTAAPTASVLPTMNKNGAMAKPSSATMPAVAASAKTTMPSQKVIPHPSAAPAAPPKMEGSKKPTATAANPKPIFKPAEPTFKAAPPIFKNPPIKSNDVIFKSAAKKPILPTKASKDAAMKDAPSAPGSKSDKKKEPKKKAAAQKSKKTDAKKQHPIQQEAASKAPAIKFPNLVMKAAPMKPTPGPPPPKPFTAAAPTFRGTSGPPPAASSAGGAPPGMGPSLGSSNGGVSANNAPGAAAAARPPFATSSTAGPTLAELNQVTTILKPGRDDHLMPAANNILHPSGRELKVEDALLYLDQVKLEFGDRPRIYNEFLEIMKNFKAQEVDTIGVINRVRRLFHGYNNLILGFNTFLPEGYKIEMRDLEPVFVGPGLPGTNSTTPLPGFMAGKSPAGRGMPGRGPPPPGGPGGRGMAFGRGGRGMPPPGRGLPGRGPPPPGGRGGRGPMPGRGGPPQLGGPGRGPGRGMVPGRGGPMPGAGRGGPPPPQGGPGGMKPSPQQQQMMQQAQNAKQKQAQMQAASQQQLQQSQAAAQSTSQAQQQQQQSQGAIATRTIEFDHAIMYVTNIKKRFANQPRIYHTFLEILHTYQKEQRGIKEVLEQVSSLFADHPDLLREFTFFLPDAVQEQAKERLSRAAAEAEAKQRAAAEAAAKQQQQAAQQQQLQAQQQAESAKNLKSAPTGWRSSAPKGKAGQHQVAISAQPPLPSGAISGAQKFIDMTQPDETGLESPRRPPSNGVNVPAQQQTQETYTYNAGVERQFFDAVKAALTSFSRDGQAYAEFIKTLDMYAQEILSRNDMLGYVERLLGKHKDLFEEFKRIINAVGSPDAPAHDDSWHSVPLSEIDFSRCRRCSPSYRALPRDYPNPPCSERSEDEVKVLNDVWVSLPMGSEENNTFRHMRKNQYEETLFRCEDMRFEIDMCIDSNATTLQRLTKINDELQFLSEHELLLTKGSMVKKSICPDGAGLGGKIYQYTLDGRVLGVIHKHAIKRIYGDDGNEMLELCFKNPAVALPIVVNRLRQKDEEWRAAREVLNRKWKDLAEHNYYKSLDHRSITWRTTDKRATSTRTIVAEIKDRAAHNGLEGEAALNARMEKAKEEHGTFYEITKGCSIPRKMDLTGLPHPTKTIFTPHLSFMYDNTSWAQQDAYRIISFALERGSISPADKESCFRLWRDFIGPWFGLSLSWMQSPAALFTASPPLEDETPTDNGEESGNEEDASSVEDNNNVDSSTDGNIIKEEIMKPESTTDVDNSYFSSTNHIPFPPETLVSTTFGEGKVVQYLKDDGIYEVSYPSSDDATAYLRTDSVFGSIAPVEPSLLTDQLRTNDEEMPERSDDQMIIGTQCMYLFFRLHQVLIRRLNIAKKLAIAVSKDTALGRHTEKLTYEGDPDEGMKRYEAFLGLVYALIDAGTGSSEASEGGKYEDRVRHLLGNNAYELTTMDKLISHILKHLQNMANDDTLPNMIEIYRRHELAGNFKPSAFREEAALMSEGENMFAFQMCNMTKTDQKISHCEFLGCIAEDLEDEEDAAMENEDHKRGFEEVAMEDTDDPATKRPKRAA